MPNHCCNTLYMSESDLQVIIDKYIGIDKHNECFFDFERIVPIGDVPDWYEQRIDKWGTKWVGYDMNIGVSVMDFFTTWSPPVPIIRKLAELHPGMVFRLEYYEPGWAFRGCITAEWRNDELLTDECSWYMTDDDLKELGLAFPSPQSGYL